MADLIGVDRRSAGRSNQAALDAALGRALAGR